MSKADFNLYVLALIRNCRGYLLVQNTKKKNSRPFLTNFASTIFPTLDAGNMLKRSILIGLTVVSDCCHWLE